MIKSPKMLRKYGQIQTSVLIASDMWQLCKEHHIKFSEAMRVGVSIMLAERGLREYDNKLQITRTRNKLVERIEELTTRKNDSA